jgi:hypothetical protein
VKATVARQIQVLVVIVESASEPVYTKAKHPTGDSRSHDSASPK